MRRPVVTRGGPGHFAMPEARSDDLAGRGAPGDFAGWGGGSRDPSPGRADGPTKELS
jgi:hypothetical protein